MIRGLFYWVAGILVTILMFFYTLATFPFFRNRNDYLHNVIHVWSSVLVKGLLGVRVRVEGLEHLREDGPFIIVSNHRSYTDILIGNTALPLQFRWLSKESLFKIPVIGWAMRTAGYVPIVRERSVSASRSLDRVKQVLNQGRSIWIFPEGTRTMREELGRFKRGAFLLAGQTGIPVLPVVLVNTDLVFETMLKARAREVRVLVTPPISHRPPAVSTGSPAGVSGRPADGASAHSAEREATDGGSTGREATRDLLQQVRHRIQSVYDEQTGAARARGSSLAQGRG
jgi:1-acyl-sn-glycerol-3-phosphate acyltransferase